MASKQGKELRMHAGPALEALSGMSGRVRVLAGGARAGKTVAILQSIILYCGSHRGEGKVVTVARAKLTWLKASVLQDWLRLLKEYGLYSEADWNKSEMVYRLFGCEVWFVGLDDMQRLHGRRQDVTFVNEAMELDQADFRQLEVRTTEYVILDFNPSRSSHFIFSSVMTRPDCDYYHCTLVDNPFLDPAIRKSILQTEPTPENVQAGTADEAFWKVYGLGERASLDGQVYTNYSFCRDFPESDRDWYGCDFGFTNDPTAVVRVCMVGGELYVDQVLYRTRLTNRDIADSLDIDLVPKNRPMYCDSAEPKSIEDLHRYGWNAQPVRKGPDSVRKGIDILKSYKINVTERSMDLKKELENYMWRKDKNGAALNEPVDKFNHALDALRYVALMELTRPEPFGPVTFARKAGPREAYGVTSLTRPNSRHGW
jgi:phage terminase large subunit